MPGGRGGGGGGGERVKGSRSTGWWLYNHHRDGKRSIRNVVNNMVQTMGPSRCLQYGGESLCKGCDWLTTMLYT